MPPDDADRIRHMMEAAETAVRLVAGRNRAELDGDIQLQLALARAIEIVGEAAANVSQSLRGRHPEIPWRNIVGMRNRMIHAYFDINLNFVWNTATVELPALLQQLRKLGPQET